MTGPGGDRVADEAATGDRDVAVGAIAGDEPTDLGRGEADGPLGGYLGGREGHVGGRLDVDGAGRVLRIRRSQGDLPTVPDDEDAGGGLPEAADPTVVDGTVGTLVVAEFVAPELHAARVKATTNTEGWIFRPVIRPTLPWWPRTMVPSEGSFSGIESDCPQGRGLDSGSMDTEFPTGVGSPSVLGGSVTARAPGECNR